MTPFLDKIRNLQRLVVERAQGVCTPENTTRRNYNSAISQLSNSIIDDLVELGAEICWQVSRHPADLCVYTPWKSQLKQEEVWHLDCFQIRVSARESGYYIEFWSKVKIPAELYLEPPHRKLTCFYRKKFSFDSPKGKLRKKMRKIIAVARNEAVRRLNFKS